MKYTNYVGKNLNCEGLMYYKEENSVMSPISIVKGWSYAYIMSCIISEGEEYLEFYGGCFVKAKEVIKELAYEIY